MTTKLDFKLFGANSTAVRPSTLQASNNASFKSLNKGDPVISLKTEKSKTEESKTEDTEPTAVKVGGWAESKPWCQKPAGKYRTPTYSGGYIEEVYNGDNDLAKVTRVDKRGDTVETEEIEYKKDDEGNVISYTQTFYDSKNKKCGSVEHFRNGNIIYRDSKGNVICKLILDMMSRTFIFVDAEGRPISGLEAAKRGDSIHPKDEKHERFIAEEANAMCSTTSKMDTKA